MKSAVLLIQWIALLLAHGASSEYSQPESWVCYHLAFSAGGNPLERNPHLADTIVMHGRLAIPAVELPVASTEHITGSLRLEKVAGAGPDEVLARRQGQHRIDLWLSGDGSFHAEVQGMTSHDMLSLSRLDSTAGWTNFKGAWSDQRGWSEFRSGWFSADRVSAPSPGSCLSMK